MKKIILTLVFMAFSTTIFASDAIILLGTGGVISTDCSVENFISAEVFSKHRPLIIDRKDKETDLFKKMFTDDTGNFILPYVFNKLGTINIRITCDTDRNEFWNINFNSLSSGSLPRTVTLRSVHYDGDSKPNNWISFRVVSPPVN